MILYIINILLRKKFNYITSNNVEKIIDVNLLY